MSFYRETVVKKPRKTHWCALCGKGITGEHIYVAGLFEGDFYADRRHTDCHEKVVKMCDNCDPSCCGGDIMACYEEKEGK